MDKLDNIKAMFVDIDGTLTDSNKTVPEENRAAIKAAVEKGIFVVICSGRGNQYVELRVCVTGNHFQIGDDFTPGECFFEYVKHYLEMK